MSGYGRQIVLTVSIAVIVSLGLGLGVYYIQPQLAKSASASPTATSSEQSSTTMSTIPILSSTSFGGSSASTYVFSSTTTSERTVAGCSTPYRGTGRFALNESSDLFLCVDYYYYNSGSPIDVVSVDQISIDANTTSAIISSPSGLRSAMSNFTISALPGNFSIGGSFSNESGGIQVVYDIHANANSNGTYILNLGWLAPGGLNSATQVENCWAEFALVVGNGSPNYSGGGTTCYTITQTVSDSSYPYPGGTLFADVIGYSNG